MNNPLVPYYFYLLGCLLFVYCAGVTVRQQGDRTAVIYFMVSVLFLVGTLLGMVQTAKAFYNL